MKHDVIIIGAGAAGLMAAISASGNNAKVLLLEKMSNPGRKLLITGKGRCNLTNIAPIEDFIKHFGRNGRFLRQVFQQFSPENLVEFLQTRNVETVIERGGRVFPQSQKAIDVVEALKKGVREKDVVLCENSRVEKLVIEDKRIVGVQLSDDGKGEIVSGSAVIIATGGKSYPATGSTGDGYKMAEAAGHKINTPFPSLVPLVTQERVPEELAGLTLKNVSAKLWIDGKKAGEEFGELEFARHGLTGPIILTLSKQVVTALNANSKVDISIDLKPALDEKKLDLRLLRDLDNLGRRQFVNVLKELMPLKLIDLCIKQVSIADDKPCHQVSSEERRTLRRWLKDFLWTITGHRGFREAIITSGGVDVKEIDPRTMGSRLIEGLYFAGEVLDVDADTGGYNLQAAFSTGWMAGNSARIYAMGE